MSRSPKAHPAQKRTRMAPTTSPRTTTPSPMMVNPSTSSMRQRMNCLHRERRRRDFRRSFTELAGCHRQPDGHARVHRSFAQRVRVRNRRRATIAAADRRVDSERGRRPGSTRAVHCRDHPAGSQPCGGRAASAMGAAHQCGAHRQTVDGVKKRGVERCKEHPIRRQ